MDIREGELDDGEMRAALKEYLSAKYGVKTVDSLKVEVASEANHARPAECRIIFRGRVEKRTQQ